MDDQNQQNEQLEAPEEQIALAAIEIIAALKGKPSDDLPEELKEWIKNNRDTKIDESMTSQSQNAIARILDNNSEIKELWEESDEYDKWVESVKDLERRIA